MSTPWWGAAVLQHPPSHNPRFSFSANLGLFPRFQRIKWQKSSLSSRAMLEVVQPCAVCSNVTKQSGAAEASLWSCPQEAALTALSLQVNQPHEVIEINPSSWFCLFQDGVLPGGGDGLHQASSGADLRLAAAAFPRCHPGVSPSSCSFFTLHL